MCQLWGVLKEHTKKEFIEGPKFVLFFFLFNKTGWQGSYIVLLD